MVGLNSPRSPVYRCVVDRHGAHGGGEFSFTTDNRNSLYLLSPKCTIGISGEGHSVFHEGETMEAITYVNIVGNHHNAQYGWYKNSKNIPAEEMVEAEKVAREVSETENEYEWRIRNYKNWRTGWAHAVRRYFPWFMSSHEEALEDMKKMCNHKWSEQVRQWGTESIHLGTYDKGYVRTCEKCGKEDYVRTAYKNYSGD